MPSSEPVKGSSEEIRRALKLFFEPNDVVELRALGKRKGHVESGYFRDLDKLADTALSLNRAESIKGVYVVMNRVNDALYSRTPDSLYPYDVPHTTTNDKDIVRRRWLLLDFDPERPSEVSSSEEEHDAAIERARKTRETLTDLGWPEPILGDSGNGAHLVYRIDLPNDERSRCLVEDCLKSIDELLGDDKVKVDLKNGNASRIWKLYGTIARKGANTPERPWRQSSILEAPTEIKVVSVEQLENLAKVWRDKPPANKNSSSKGLGHGKSRYPKDLAQWCADRGIEIARTKSASNGTIFVFERCPWDDGHTDKSAWAIQREDDSIVAGCHHNGCSGNGWPELRALYEPDAETQEPEADVGDEQAEIKLDDVSTLETKSDGKVKIKFSPMMAAEAVISKFTLVTTASDKRIWIYENGIYVPTGEDTINKVLTRVARDYYSISSSNETIQKVKMLTMREDLKWNPDPFLFGVKNCVVNLRDGTTRPYSPEDFITLRSPIVYDPEASCPEISRFLASSLKGDEDVLTVVDLFVDMSITKALPFFVSMIGPGSNGKKVLETIMQCYVGYDQVTHVRLDALDANSFIRGDINGKRLLINTEVSGKKMESHWMKAISSGDRMESDRKNSTRIEFEPYCLIVIDTNDPPKFHDRSHGFSRRFVKLDFPYVFSDNPNLGDPLQKKADPDLEKKVVTDSELSGLLNAVMRRAPDVIRTMKIHRKTQGKKLVDEYDKQSHSYKTFIDLFCDSNDEIREDGSEPRRTFTKSVDFYAAYERYCSKINAVPVSQTKLIKQIGDEFNQRSKKGPEETGSKQGLFGVELLTEELDHFISKHEDESPDASKLVRDLFAAKERAEAGSPSIEDLIAEGEKRVQEKEQHDRELLAKYKAEADAKDLTCHRLHKAVGRDFYMNKKIDPCPAAADVGVPVCLVSRWLRHSGYRGFEENGTTYYMMPSSGAKA